MGFKSFPIFPTALLIGAATMGAPAARADMLVIQGEAQVIDTATVEIWGQRIRLSGIAVPDPASQDGARGRRFLQGFLAGVRLRCEVQEAPLRIELPGRCFAAKVDIAGTLVQMGYARKLAEEPEGSDLQSDSAERPRSSSPAVTRRSGRGG